MTRTLILLDAGHGGIFDGKYVTPGKRSKVFSDGFQLFEGENNRHIRWKLGQLLKKEGIKFKFVNEGNKDMSINDRINYANSLIRKHRGPVILISIHSNGHSDENSNGWEVWTSKGEDESDVFAEIVANEAANKWDWAAMRREKANHADKESSLFGILKVKCPSVLTENFFHTNEKEARFIGSKKGRNEIAGVHFKAIMKWINQH